jgi:microcin C transport system substrate-binding protein
LFLLSACGGGNGGSSGASATDENSHPDRATTELVPAADSYERLPDVTAADPSELSGLAAEIREYYDTKVNLPPDVFEAKEAGKITEEEIARRAEAGEFQKFFRFATPGDLPENLPWENGANLPEIGSNEAVKGGISYGRLQDFPRTLRLVGPDANGSFRPILLDDTQMSFAHRHPIKTDIGPTGFFYFPGLAKRWAVVPEDKKVYVELDPAARWSDGEAVTVEDVFFMFYFFQSPWINAPWYNNWYNRNYTQVTRYDEHTFSIEVPEAKPDMSSRVLELRAVPAHFYGDFSENYVQDYQWRFEPTTSPYVILPGDLEKGQYIRLTRQREWWAKDRKFWKNRYNADIMHLRVIRDTSKAFEAFKKGELDSFGMNLAEYHYDRLPNDDRLIENGYINKYTFYNDVPRPTFGLWINQAMPLLDNRDVRVGLNFATNWERVIEEYFRGDAVRMRTSSDGYGAFTHPGLRARPFDVDKALESFAKAGFTERNSEGILVNDSGEELSFTLTTGYEIFKDLLAILQEEALKAGVKYNLEVLDATAGWKKAQEKKHEIMFSAFGVSPEMYPRFWETYHSVNAYDQAFLSDGTINPDRELKTQTNNLQSIAIYELDRLIEQYRASESTEEMIDLAHAMEELLREDASFIPGFVRPFYRWASWRWVAWPEDLNVELSESPGHRFLHWFKPGAREATLRAEKRNEVFEKVIEINDTHNVYSGETTVAEN